MADPILVARAGGVLTVTLNRPEKKNAVTQEMWGDLRDIFREANERADDRVVIVTGAGGEFCSGADLTSGGGVTEFGLMRMRVVGEAALALHRLTKPTIAKVPGVAAGAGCNLALGCDLIVAAERARFAEIFVKRGLSLDFGGSWLLPRLVGLHKAKELAFFGDVIGAAEAERIGIVNHVVPDDALDDFVADWAARLSAAPPIALSMTKRLLNHAAALTMEQTVEDEGRAQTVNMATRDTQEAMLAFVERREPTFEGR